MFYQHRERIRQRAESGETPMFGNDFGATARTRLYWAMTDSAPRRVQGYGASVSGDYPTIALATCARDFLLREWGTRQLAGPRPPLEDFFESLDSAPEPGQVLDLVEAWGGALRALAPDYDLPEAMDNYRARVNAAFDDELIAFQMVGHDILPRESMALHAGVVVPTLQLLHGQPTFAEAEVAFRKALHELKPDGDPADAVTDAGTALQEALKAMGVLGGTLGEQIKKAAAAGLLGERDGRLEAGVREIAHWVRETRNNLGDAHNARAATQEDAWLAVHVVGALILRMEKRFSNPQA